VVAWRKFITGYPKAPDSLYCFFEGEDVKYFGFRIDEALSSPPRCNIECSGKLGVLRLLKLFEKKKKRKKYAHAWAAFFVDRDFDDDADHPSHDALYVTPCYSIENLYVTTTAVGKMLQDEFRLADQPDNDLSNAIGLYETALNSFNEAMEELNVWVFINREREKNGQASRLNLSNWNLEQLVQVDLNGVKAKYTLADLNAKLQNGTVITEAEIRARAKTLAAKDGTQLFRGKFLAEFLRLFLRDLKEDRRSDVPVHFAQKGIVPLSVSRRNLLSELCQHADTPPCLRTFLGLREGARPSCRQA
jgi:hypothetical protein